ncbi:unnamed protein product [Paramecium octaurelia]|uniref:Uncharacterized protein n=1 Tax=Paramecium octaurelia TaxID=43137 RepID=A0A8S1SBP1_PAROT|nr:unnamed protein product [Paramecium octaurelia]
MKKLEQVNTYLHKFDETILKLLKESNVNTIKRTQPKSIANSEQHTKQQDEIINNIQYTPVSNLENSQLKKSEILENANSYRIFRSRQQIKTQTFEKNQPQQQSIVVNSPINSGVSSPNQASSSINIVERLKTIEQHYGNKIKILEEENTQLRKTSQNDKVQIQSLESQVQRLETDLKEQQKLFQEILSKQLNDQKQQMQFELEEQETRLKRQFERQISRKDQKIVELEQWQQKKKSHHTDSNNTNLLFTFKTNDH